MEAPGPDEALVKFMHPSVMPGIFQWPQKDDIARVKLVFIFCSDFNAPVPVSGGRQYKLADCEELEQKFSYFKKWRWPEE